MCRVPTTYRVSGPLSLLPCFPSPSFVGVVHEGCVAYFSLLYTAILGGKDAVPTTGLGPTEMVKGEGSRDGSRWLGGRAEAWVCFFTTSSLSSASSGNFDVTTYY